MMTPFDPQERDDGTIFDVLVAPRASKVRIGPVVGDRLKIAVASPPVDGEANEAVRDALARALGVPRAAVEILRGQSSRRKTLRVAGITRARILALLEGAS
jgi:uncharacterized protein (TIGR00251 family)